LGEEVHFADLRHLGFKYVDEELADRLALGLGVRNTIERIEKNIPCAGHNQVQVKVLPVEFFDRFGLTFTHESVVNIDTGQLSADRTVDQGSRD